MIANYKCCYFRGEDEITRERMESCRSENERRHRAASTSDAGGAFEQRSKSRTSSSSSQETVPASSTRGNRVHSAHPSSPSPSSSRRNTVTSTVDKSQMSPSLEPGERTARSLTGSLSSPGSSSNRPSRNLSTAQAIALAASTASSPMFQQTSALNSGPHSTSSTVINVPGEQRKLSSNSGKDGQIKTTSNFPEGDTSTIKLGSTNNTLVGNTHIIKVSGPVTNLDETVLSAVGMEGSLMTSSISEHSTTSTASASSSIAPVLETREVHSSPIPSSLSSTLAYDIGYSTSPDKQSLKSSALEYSTNDSNYEAITHPQTISPSSISMANISSDNRSISQGTISESKDSPLPSHSLSTSDLSELQNNKNQNISLSTTIPMIQPPTSTSSNESAPASNTTDTTTVHGSPKIRHTNV